MSIDLELMFSLCVLLLLCFLCGFVTQDSIVNQLQCSKQIICMMLTGVELYSKILKNEIRLGSISINITFNTTSEVVVYYSLSLDD